MAGENLHLTYRGTDLVLEQATLEYLLDVDPHLEWDRRGLKASEYGLEDRKRTSEMVKERIREGFDSDGARDKIRDFIDEALPIYEELQQDGPGVVSALFDDRPFYFIIGAPRTGGTYLLNELMRVQGETLRNYHLNMISDHLPVGDHVTRHHQPDRRKRLYFDLAQWLLWVSRELDHLDCIIKKNVHFPHALPIIDEIFENRATYVVTNRHPGEIAESYAVREGIEERGPRVDHRGIQQIVQQRSDIDDDRWTTLSYHQQMLTYWCVVYLEITDFPGPTDSLRSLGFGPEYESFVESFARERGVEDFSPEAFEPSDRTVDDYWDSPEALNRLREVQSSWLERFGEWSLDVP